MTDYVSELAASQAASFSSAPLTATTRFLVKEAESEWEFEQIHRLNYRVFVDELGQHDANEEARLIDKFHHKNRYFIALNDNRVVGMIAANDTAPFSVASRLKDPSLLEQPGMRPLELRLLAVQPEERYSLVFGSLAYALFTYAEDNGYTDIFISGITNREQLYRRLGFKPLGMPVQDGRSAFLPMRLTIADAPTQIRRDLERWRRSRTRCSEQAVPQHSISFLPGPVQISEPVLRAFREPPISHRRITFRDSFERSRAIISEIAGGYETAVLCGSGTLANEAIAAAIAADRTLGPGVVLTNGEFGERLARQAQRFRLTFRTISVDWGLPWNLSELSALMRRESVSWVWGVHHESSTGMLNDLSALRASVLPETKLFLDCVSSLGAVPLDLQQVALASSASGKALGSVAGLAFVLVAPKALAHVDSSLVPQYLDLQAALSTCGPRFTFPSPQVAALETALRGYADHKRRKERYESYAALGRLVRSSLNELGLPPLVDEPQCGPIITTFLPPEGQSSVELIQAALDRGLELSGLSGYLRERNWIQVATMGAITPEDCRVLFSELRLIVKRLRSL